MGAATDPLIAEEARVVELAMARRERRLLEGGVLAGALYQLSTIFSPYLHQVEAWTRIGVPIAIVILVLDILLLLARARIGRRTLIAASWILAFTTTVSTAILAYGARQTHAPHVQIVLGEMLLMVSGSFHIMATFHRGAIIAAYVCQIALIAPCYLHLVDERLANFTLIIVPLSHTFALVAQLSSMRSMRASFARDFRERLKTAPLQIVRRSMESGDAVSELFKPAERSCVCICSDWRSYQKLTGRLSAAKVVELLADYYAGTSQILRTAFPNGNVFSDWIADELFVVAFSEERTDAARRELAQGAVRFGEELLKMKDDFAKRHSLPLGIDVGVAGGLACVGIMGPDEHQKATALGEVPGRSRRLQTAAKELRSALGPADRLVIGAEVFVALGPSLEALRFAPFEVTPGRTKDLGDTEIFFAEAGAGPEVRLRDAELGSATN